MSKRSVFGGILATIGLFALQGSALTFAETTGSASFSVDIDNAVLELTVPSSPAVIDLNPTMTDSAFGTASLNIHVATNNQTGYTLTMTPNSSDYNNPHSLIRTALVGSEQTYRRIDTLAQTTPTSTGYTKDTFTANRWGYRILANSNYYGIDSTNPTVSSSAWVTNEPTNGTDHNLTVAAKVDSNTVSGSYATTLVFTATTNAVVAKDNISFNGNGADNSTAMDNVSFSVLSGTTGTLPTNQYVRTGYAFLGWNTASDGSGRTYANEGVYTATSTTYSNNVTLYAMWEDTTSPIYNILHPGGSGLGSGVTISLAYEIAYTAAGKGMWEKNENDDNYTQISDGVYHNRDVRWDLQGMTTEICNSVTVLEDSYQAIDTRDFRKYNIAKLQDGRCWLQDNLALDPTDLTIAGRMDASNTNASADAIYNYLHGGNPTGESGWTSTAVYEMSPGAMADQFSYAEIDTTQIETVSNDALDQAGTWKVGVYYNYCAASIGTYCYARYTTQLDRPGTDIDVIYDVCPFGWRMPTSGDEADGQEYKNVLKAYYDAGVGTGSFNDYRRALHLPFSGEHNYWGDIRDVGSSAYFWSATYAFRSNAPDSEMSAASIRSDPSAGWGGYWFRGYTASIRCIAK